MQDAITNGPISRILRQEGIGIVSSVELDSHDPSTVECVYRFCVNPGAISSLEELEEVITRNHELEKMKRIINSDPELKRLYRECETFDTLSGGK